jgi:hypothetical protein
MLPTSKWLGPLSDQMFVITMKKKPTVRNLVQVCSSNWFACLIDEKAPDSCQFSPAASPSPRVEASGSRSRTADPICNQKVQKSSGKYHLPVHRRDGERNGSLFPRCSECIPLLSPSQRLDYYLGHHRVPPDTTDSLPSNPWNGIS